NPSQQSPRHAASNRIGRNAVMRQGNLFTAALDDARPDSCDCSACTTTQLDVVCERTGAHPDFPFDDVRGAFNHCTLEGKPARILGRASPYAAIEAVDLELEPIRCCWDVVAHVLQERDGAFSRADDDTDE